MPIEYQFSSETGDTPLKGELTITDLRPALYLKAASEEVTEEDCAVLVRAFEPLAPHVWYGTQARVNADLSDLKIPDILSEVYTKREWESFHNFELASRLRELKIKHRSFRTVVGALAPDSAGFLVKFFKPFDWKFHSILAFVPPGDLNVIASWSRVFLGMEWLWNSPDKIADAPIPSIDYDPVCRCLISQTLEIGGVACLTWEDSNVENGLAVFAESHILNSIGERLNDSQSLIHNAGLIKKLISTGYRFIVSL